MKIRQAAPEDAAMLGSLYRELVDNPAVQVVPARLATLAADPGHQLLVVEDGGKLLATAHLIFCADAMFGEQFYALLENVVVSRDARGHGVGTRLFRHIELLARQANCSKVMLLSGADRSDAHRFFASQGYSGDRKRGFVKYRSQFAPVA
ncbi:GNAT family N-acetyltransferase [Chitinimonas arctica]|uniref:GNAT family N-acetyltransferase n=1 Tax=Chitinimonas arctica TaxID=2594795 RepID=A0A516SCA2_9NEIS|nr:GNAT family N-acetyltransferase [Chitinimonas arctica]QDQ25777.1 GNAT family N-acetyltransferase [Chitinimonas arctica]